MTSPDVTLAASLARAAAGKIDGASSTFARRLIAAASLTDAMLTPDALLAARRAVRAVAPGASLPSAMASMAVVEAFARLTASATVLARAASMAESLDSPPLARRVASTALSMLGHVGRISDAFARIEAITGGAGLGDLEVSDFMRAGGALLVLLGPASAGGTIVPGAIAIGLASIVDEIDGTGSEAAELARAACDEQQRSIGRPCTPDEWAAFYARSRADEREDSFDRVVRGSFEKLLAAVASAGFWLLLIGAAGAALYVAWPAIASRATSSLGCGDCTP